MSRRLLISIGSSSVNLTAVRPFVSEPFVDHYAVLGVDPNASAKEIKSAFYSLSKKYHPDRNRDNPSEAAAKFHQVSMAYEVLGSDERRKLYDLTRIRTSRDYSGPHLRQASSSTSSSTKQYTDLDIDYKDFEHFQRHTRQRKQYHSHFDMPEEFYAEFGGRKREFKSKYDPPMGGFIHKDSRARQREEEELLREIQREQERQQKKYPIPTFEQMMREKRQKQREENRKQVAGALGLVTIAATVLWIAEKFFRK